MFAKNFSINYYFLTNFSDDLLLQFPYSITRFKKKLLRFQQILIQTIQNIPLIPNFIKIIAF